MRKDKSRANDFKEQVLNWIKNNPTQAKIIAVCILVALFCIILFSCTRNEEEQTKQQTDQQQTVVPNVPAPAQETPPPPVTEIETPAPAEEYPAEHIVDLGKNVELKLVKINAGTYMKGLEKNKLFPQKEVTISDDFYIGIYEITQEQYQSVMKKNPSRFKGKKLPVENINWGEATIFCDMLNEEGRALAGWKFTLPTSDQWEYACRAGSTTIFSWGNQLNGSQANCNGTKPYPKKSRKGTNLKKTRAVGSYKPNAWGLYDMHGNVWEWCLNNGKMLKISGKEVRGGSWKSPAQDCCSAAFTAYKPNQKNERIGFRIVMVKAD